MAPLMKFELILHEFSLSLVNRKAIFQISPSKKLSIVLGDSEIGVVEVATHIGRCSGF